MRHGEVAALRWTDIDLKRGIISRSRDSGEDNAPKTAGLAREIPMLPWVVDLSKRLPGRLHSDGSEFVFLTPEGKPMTDSWWPKRGAARRPVDEESRGIWFRDSSQSWDSAAEVPHHPAHVYRVGTLGRRQLKRAEYCGTSVQMIEQSYDRYIRKDFLGLRIAARPKALRATGGKPHHPSGLSGKSPEFPTEFWWRREIENPDSGEPGKKRSIFKGLPSRAYPAKYRDLPLVVPQGQSRYSSPKGR
jgi:hypothetical protein